MAEDFTLNDFRRQFDQIARIGMKDMIGAMPGISEMIPEGEDPEVALERVKRMIDAMTEEERNNPDIIDADRRARIAASSDTQPHDVEQFLVEFARLRDMMRQIAGMGFWQRVKMVLGIGRIPGLDERI